MIKIHSVKLFNFGSESYEVEQKARYALFDIFRGHPKRSSSNRHDFGKQKGILVALSDFWSFETLEGSSMKKILTTNSSIADLTASSAKT
jgi:hypothetical protein